MDNNRRSFLRRTALAGAAAMLPAGTISVPRAFAKPVAPSAPKTAVSIASNNGMAATARAVELIEQGTDTLDAVIAGVNIVEDDPNDMSVGYGGLPNEDGIVELDSCVMHGPTGRGAGVAALRNIRNPSQVAKVVMERSDHVLIVGEGALRFARAHGFREENLLTDAAREAWLEWKEHLSTEDDWLPVHDKNTPDIGMLQHDFQRPTGTINCLAVNTLGEISGVTTTSGLAFKIPGRVGDSPILGAGLYVDGAVGAAGSTGRGEANLLSCASVLIVEYMSQGHSPEEACLMACERVIRQTRMRRLLKADGRVSFNVNYYALNVSGEYGGASIYPGKPFALNTGGESRLVEMPSLYKTP